jgi:hypothetical protein
MRRLLLVLVPSLLVAGALAGAAAAKEANLELSSTPAGTKAGEAWNVTVTVFAGHGEEVEAAATPPVITIRNVDTGERRTFTAGPSDVLLDIAPARNWDARVVFPSAGTWDYEIDDGWTGRVYEFGPVVIGGAPVVAAPAAGRPADGQGAGFPVWPFAGGLAAALVAAAAAVLTFRRRRFGAA